MEQDEELLRSGDLNNDKGLNISAYESDAEILMSSPNNEIEVTVLFGADIELLQPVLDIFIVNLIFMFYIYIILVLFIMKYFTE